MTENNPSEEFDLVGLLDMQEELLNFIPHEHKIPEKTVPVTIAAIGFIEEICEYVEACGHHSFNMYNPCQPVIGVHYKEYGLKESNKDEEISDTLFFYLEMMLFQDFTPRQVFTEVDRIRDGCKDMQTLLDSFQFMETSNVNSFNVNKLCNVALALINRTLVFLGTTGFKSWRPNPLSRDVQLREFAIVTIVYGELLKASFVSLHKLKQLYIKKWAINKSRWSRAKSGDYEWDKRGEESHL